MSTENTTTIIDEQIPEVSDATPTEVGMTLFGMKAATFKRRLNDLSKGELKRLVRAMVFSGMEPPEFGNNHNPDLPGIIAMGRSLIEAKFIMSINAAMKAEEAAQESAESSADATNDATEGKEVNGTTHS